MPSLQLKKLTWKEKRMLLHKKKISSQRAFWEYYKILCKILDATGALLQDHKLTKQYQADEITYKWLESQLQTMILKLNVIKMQLLTDTYTTETTPGLRKIRGHLELAYQETVEQFEQAVQKISEYESVGGGFDKLVAEYSAILQDIKEKKWAMSELLKNNT